MRALPAFSRRCAHRFNDHLLILAAWALLGALPTGCVGAEFGESRGGEGVSRHTALGLPSPTSSADPDHFLSVKSEYVISYNSSRKVPNWVSWELNASYLGNAARQDDYRPDDTLPAHLPQASIADYNKSGFDRGHLCPSGDRTQTTAANSQTFYLTNMVPQAANSNRGPWERLEDECRSLASTGKELYIVAGGLFSRASRTIGSGVVVPDQTFKVVVVLDDIGRGASAVDVHTRVIGVVMPNDDGYIDFSHDWRDFRVSVDAIEAATGDDFLSDVDPAVQGVIESRVDNQ